MLLLLTTTVPELSTKSQTPLTTLWIGSAKTNQNDTFRNIPLTLPKSILFIAHIKTCKINSCKKPTNWKQQPQHIDLISACWFLWRQYPSFRMLELKIGAHLTQTLLPFDSVRPAAAETAKCASTKGWAHLCWSLCWVDILQMQRENQDVLDSGFQLGHAAHSSATKNLQRFNSFNILWKADEQMKVQRVI